MFITSFQFQQAHSWLGFRANAKSNIFISRQGIRANLSIPVPVLLNLAWLRDLLPKLLSKFSPQCWEIKMCCTKPDTLKHCPTAVSKVYSHSVLIFQRDTKNLNFGEMGISKKCRSFFFIPHFVLSSFAASTEKFHFENLIKFHLSVSWEGGLHVENELLKILCQCHFHKPLLQHFNIHLLWIYLN